MFHRVELRYIGQVAQQGATLGIEQINNSGGINGKKLVGIFADSENKPQKAVDLTKRLIEKDRCRRNYGHCIQR